MDHRNPNPMLRDSSVRYRTPTTEAERVPALAACRFSAARYASAPTHRHQCDEAQETTHGSRDSAQAAPDYHAPMDFSQAHDINVYRHSQRPDYRQRSVAS
jgi:hypothetical protein